MLKQSLSILKQFGSVGKCQDATDLLHEDLVMVEQRVEPAKKAAQVVHKKLQGCLQSQQGLEAEKRMKKLPLMLLSVSMAESLKDFDADSPIRRVLEMCCFMEKMLANMLADFEMKVEKEVMEPLNKLSEEDLPEVLKNKKLFAKLTMDWNNARNRSQASTGPQAKQDGLREEVEEAWRKLENIRDQYSADLYHFATKEDNYANYFIRLLELQADYHKSSNEFLHHYITELKDNSSPTESSMSFSKTKVYGDPLLSHLTESNREIAAPIQECVHMLLRTGMREEGLFRLAAAASVVKRLKTCLDRGVVDHSEFSTDPHAVAGALKCYLRELPEPLMTSELYDDWFKAAGEKELSDKLEHFRRLLKRLPPENYDNLRYLFQFLSLLCEQQAINKMTPSNIAIVLGPNLLWPHLRKETTLDMASASSVQVVTVIEPLIQHSSVLFPEAVLFEIPLLPESPVFSPSVSDVTSPGSEKERLSVKTSSSSTSSSCSSNHGPLPTATSPNPQDGGGFFIMKSGSVRRTGATTWQNLTTDTAGSTHPNPLPSSSLPPRVPSTSLDSTSSANPTPAPRTPAPKAVQVKQSSDAGQLESILEDTPESPKVVLQITSPYKPKRSFNPAKGPNGPNGPNGQHVVQYTKPPAPTTPKPHVPAPPSTAEPNAQPQCSSTAVPLITKRSTIKKLKAPKCPPPLPPLMEAKGIPPVAQ